MSRIIRTRQSRLDLIEIAIYIGAENPAAADRFLDHIDAKLQLLATHVELGQARPEIAIGVRSFGFRNYVLFYRPVEGGIELIRVLHAARETDALF
jgi:toxin ParE1/3/4